MLFAVNSREGGRRIVVAADRPGKAETLETRPDGCGARALGKARIQNHAARLVAHRQRFDAQSPGCSPGRRCPASSRRRRRGGEFLHSSLLRPSDFPDVTCVGAGGRGGVSARREAGPATRPVFPVVCRRDCGAPPGRWPGCRVPDARPRRTPSTCNRPPAPR